MVNVFPYAFEEILVVNKFIHVTLCYALEKISFCQNEVIFIADTRLLLTLPSLSIDLVVVSDNLT